jgi:EpsD family peptidyl-prolyl cis-trans isomerase
VTRISRLTEGCWHANVLPETQIVNIYLVLWGSLDEIGISLKQKILRLVATCLVLALGACHFQKPKAPTGQVAATVGNREITVREVHAELGGRVAPTSALEKANEQNALGAILERVILANSARDQGLDKDPQFLLLEQRQTDALLAQQLEAKIAANVPAPTREEAEQFELANPNMFTERKIFHLEQIRMARPTDKGITAKLVPLNTLDEVAEFLVKNNISFQRGTNTIDALGESPELTNKIVALAPQEIFILSSPSEIFIDHIQNTETQPFIGEPATKFALNFLRESHIRAAVQKGIGALLAKARGSIRLNKDFQFPTKAAHAPAKSG